MLVTVLLLKMVILPIINLSKEVKKLQEQTLEKLFLRMHQEGTQFLEGLQILEAINVLEQPEQYEKISIETALCAESLANSMRHIIYAATDMNKLEYMEKVILIQGITIQKIKQGHKIEIPVLLPKRKVAKDMKYITEPLFYALEKYSKAENITKYHQCVVCFVHIYNQNLPTNRVRDYDNIEQKKVLDTIAAFFMTDDSGKLCDLFQTTLYDEKDCTQIYIMEKSVFPSWLRGQKKTMLIG